MLYEPEVNWGELKVNRNESAVNCGELETNRSEAEMNRT